MSFQDFLPICPLDLSLSLNLLLFHIYFKFSSFCLCHSSLRSLSPSSLSASKNLFLPILRTAHTSSVEVGRLLFPPLFHSLVGVSQEKHLGPCEAGVRKQTELLWWEEHLGVSVCLLGPRQSGPELGVVGTDSRVRRSGFSASLPLLCDHAWVAPQS